MENQPRGWRKFLHRRKGKLDQNRVASKPALLENNSHVAVATKDTRASNTHHQKASADSDHATRSVLSTLEDTSPQAGQNFPLSEGPDTKDQQPLWDRAYEKLRKEKPEVVEEYERILAKTADIQRNLPLNETMKAVVDNRVGLMTNRQWKIRIPWRKGQMLVTELVDKIVNVVLKFKTVGSTVASIDPIHAGIPFAAICFLLPIVTNASEERVSSLKGLGLVADLVDLYSEAECIYLVDFMDSIEGGYPSGITFASEYGQFKIKLLDLVITNRHEDVVEFLFKEGKILGVSASYWAMQHVLHKAADEGDCAAALWLLKKGADANAIDQKGRTALHKVGRYSQVSVARLLIQYGADSTKADESSRTPLHEAVSSTFNESGELVQLLLENKAKVEARDTNQRTPLHEAARNGSATALQLLLEKGADIEAKDDKGQTPLQEACFDLGSKKMRLLLQKGADINKTNCNGCTALHIVSARGNSEGVKLLLSQHGIDPNSQDEDGNTPLSLAMRDREACYSMEDDNWVVKLLLVHGGVDWDAKGDNGLLWHAMLYGKEEHLVQKLIEIGKINVEEEYIFGGTLLRHAISKGYEPSIRLLLERGANIESEGGKQRTALHIAICRLNLKMARLLLEQRADIEARDKYGYTPLMLAFTEALEDKEPCTELFDLLLEKGADVNAVDDYGNSVLYNTVLVYNEALVRYLLGKGANTSLKNKRGMTALHWAASMIGDKGLATVKLLIEYGSDKMARNDEGKIPLDYTRRDERKILKEVLSEYPISDIRMLFEQ
ncbi:MAG: hypothetical protein Q9187_008105 [Circinaria calcarea]